MKLSPIKSKGEWDDFLKKNEGIFLQSFAWGKFKEKYQKVGRIEARRGSEIVGVCQFFEEKLPFGSYFYIPFGPVAKEKQVREKLFRAVAKKAKEEGKIFVKTEPLEEVETGINSLHRIQPQKTIVLEIKENPDIIFQSFRKNTRYSIRQAQKKGVTIEKGEKESDLNIFFDLLEKTKERQEFSSYNKKYFKEITKEIDTDLFLAKYENKTIAASLFLYFGNTVTFLHSAFDHNYRNLNASTLIIFESIKDSKKKGCVKYDFWGINEKKFPGVTKFKKGFGGEEIVYPQGKDIPTRKILYFFYYIASIIKRKK